MNIKKNIKNENLDKILLDKWINNSILEENVEQINTKKNDYSTMSYQMWLGVKNYMEITTSDNNNVKVINKNTNIKNSIKIYTIDILHKIFSISKLKISMGFNKFNNNLLFQFFNI